MAKLHRRVSRLPHHHVARLAAIACVSFALCAMPARAQSEEEDEIADAGDPRLTQLEEHAASLASDDEAARRRAYDALSTLGEDMLPAIRARLRVLRRDRSPEIVAFDVFSRIRRAAGSERADDDVDIAPGVLAVLGEDRRPRVLKIAEPLLLWRSLERLGTFEAGRTMLPLVSLDGEVWRWEARRVARRMGPRIMAAAITARNHPDPRIRAWAIATMRRLHADEPGLAVQGLAHDVLPDVLRAYAMLRMQGAMRVIVSYIDSDRRSVRQAARWAIDQYGGNAIWILRGEYMNQRGEHPPQAWGFARVKSELYAHIDAQRMSPSREALERGVAARDRGELAAMRREFEEVLARTPDVDDAAPMAIGYAALARERIAAGRSEEASWALRRALRIAPDHAEAPRWRAELLYLDAERARGHGVMEDAAYRAVLALDPQHEGAASALESMSARAMARESEAPSWAWVAAVLFAVLGGALLALGLRGRRSVQAAFESTIEAPTFEEAEATLADSTLPG
jgi:hypothetical protein